MAKEKDTTTSSATPRGALVVGAPRPTGSVEAAAAAQGKSRPRKRGKGKQIYCSDYIGELLAKYSDTHGVSQKFFTDKALAAALEKEGVEVELRAFRE